MKILPVYKNHRTTGNTIRIPYKSNDIDMSTFLGNALSPFHMHADLSAEHVHNQLRMGIWTRVEYATTTSI